MTTDEALAKLSGPIPKQFSAAIAARWKALKDETAAERLFNGELKPAEAQIRHHVSDTLLSRKIRRAHPLWWIEWASTRLHFVNYDTRAGKRPEFIGPSLRFSLLLGNGQRIATETHMDNRAQLDALGVRGWRRAEAPMEGGKRPKQRSNAKQAV